ncbi:NAD-dependent succinate-semialdehyde dehydrogenase [Rhodohalobacter sp. 614A]|uniref:NAD-dependent succinate-semialdehyde dehydrogenase n=1 Tax=Rhodohalobacter sp. 614A TaxID=2908649 RepID=UPI001F43CEDE|nr:NAD-dependent succinate-semialdehyde dehydrogenase [Rhodohalobacter sp. 614A]
MAYETINPATGEKIKTFDELSDADINKAIEKADSAFQSWKKTSFSERAELLKKVGELLRDRKEELGKLMTLEMGKPIKEGISEAEKCAWVCDFYAENAENFLSEEPVESDASESFLAYNPLGVVLAVMPWNFPFWQVFRFAAPATMAGNTGVLKHASNVPQCAEAIEKLFTDAGYPEGVFQNLLMNSDQIPTLLEHPAIKAATLTGSEYAGSAVAKKAGEMIKKTVLELGGSDPYVVLADADLEETAKTCATSRMINSGQSCIAAKRFIVEKSVIDEFTNLFTKQMKTFEMGNPSDENTKLGPMAREDLRDDIHEQVQKSIEAGATCTLGGEIPDKDGAWYPATILTGVKKGMPAFDEEIFGPVAAIIEAEDEEHAIELANDSKYGLGAAVFTQDVEKGRKIAAEKLEAGCCFVNEFVRSDPRLPFGGIKMSGYGRELSKQGIREFVNLKTVYVA